MSTTTAWSGTAWSLAPLALVYAAGRHASLRVGAGDGGDGPARCPPLAAAVATLLAASLVAFLRGMPHVDRAMRVDLARTVAADPVLIGLRCPEGALLRDDGARPLVAPLLQVSRALPLAVKHAELDPTAWAAAAGAQATARARGAARLDALKREMFDPLFLSAARCDAARAFLALGGGGQEQARAEAVARACFPRLGAADLGALAAGLSGSAPWARRFLREAVELGFSLSRPPPGSGGGPAFEDLGRLAVGFPEAGGEAPAEVVVVDRTYFKTLLTVFAPLLVACLLAAVAPGQPSALRAAAFGAATAAAGVLLAATTRRGLQGLRIRDLVFAYVVAGSVVWNAALLLAAPGPSRRDLPGLHRPVWETWAAAALQAAFPGVVAAAVYAALPAASSFVIGEGPGLAALAVFTAAVALAAHAFAGGAGRTRGSIFAARHGGMMLLLGALYAVHRWVRGLGDDARVGSS